MNSLILILAKIELGEPSNPKIPNHFLHKKGSIFDIWMHNPNWYWSTTSIGEQSILYFCPLDFPVLVYSKMYTAGRLLPQCCYTGHSMKNWFCLFDLEMCDSFQKKVFGYSLDKKWILWIGFFFCFTIHTSKHKQPMQYYY